MSNYYQHAKSYENSSPEERVATFLSLPRPSKERMAFYSKMTFVERLAADKIVLAEDALERATKPNSLYANVGEQMKAEEAARKALEPTILDLQALDLKQDEAQESEELWVRDEISRLVPLAVTASRRHADFLAGKILPEHFANYGDFESKVDSIIHTKNDLDYNLEDLRVRAENYLIARRFSLEKRRKNFCEAETRHADFIHNPKGLSTEESSACLEYSRQRLKHHEDFLSDREAEHKIELTRRVEEERAYNEKLRAYEAEKVERREKLAEVERQTAESEAIEKLRLSELAERSEAEADASLTPEQIEGKREYELVTAGSLFQKAQEKYYAAREVFLAADGAYSLAIEGAAKQEAKRARILADLDRNKAKLEKERAERLFVSLEKEKNSRVRAAQLAAKIAAAEAARNFRADRDAAKLAAQQKMREDRAELQTHRESARVRRYKQKMAIRKAIKKI